MQILVQFHDKNIVSFLFLKMIVSHGAHKLEINYSAKTNCSIAEGSTCVFDLNDYISL